MVHRNSRNQVIDKTSPQKGSERRASLSPGNAKRPFKRREAWRITHSVAVMNGRRFGNALAPSSSSSSSSSFSHRGKSSLLLPRYSFFRVSHVHGMYIRAGLHQAHLSLFRLSRRKWRHGPFWLAKEKRCSRMLPVRSPVLSSYSHAGRHCRVDLRGPREFSFKETPKKKKKASLLSLLFPGVFGFIGPPEIFNALAYTGIYSSLSHFVARRGHWWTRGLEVKSP